MSITKIVLAHPTKNFVIDQRSFLTKGPKRTVKFQTSGARALREERLSLFNICSSQCAVLRTHFPVRFGPLVKNDLELSSYKSF